ncbi:MAG: hypothetical protein ACI8PZ_000056 [Myxococcota bacterium]|jgi:hypothetical protein
MSEVRSLQILWIAFAVTPLLFALIAFGGVLPAPPAGDPMMAATLGVLATLVGAFGLVGAPLVLKNMAAQPAYLVRFSCAEAIGVFGLVAHVSGASAPVVIAFLGISFGFTVIMRPTEEAYTRWELRRMM